MTEPTKSKGWYLKRFNLFQELSSEEIEHLISITQLKKVPKDALFYTPDDLSDTIFLIKEGRVKISLVSEGGREVILTILERGEIFGELALIDESPRGTIAQALVDTYICEMSRDDFQWLLKLKPDLAFEVIKHIGGRLKAIQSKIEDVIFRDVRTRLAKTLLELAAKYGSKIKTGIRIEVKLTHRELASLIGATRETVTSALNDFRRNGFVEADKRQIVLKDPSSLEFIAKQLTTSL